MNNCEVEIKHFEYDNGTTHTVYREYGSCLERTKIKELLNETRWQLYCYDCNTVTKLPAECCDGCGILLNIPSKM